MVQSREVSHKMHGEKVIHLGIFHNSSLYDRHPSGYIGPNALDNQH